jgi:hypothetical protein
VIVKRSADTEYCREENPALPSYVTTIGALPHNTASDERHPAQVFWHSSSDAYGPSGELTHPLPVTQEYLAHCALHSCEVEWGPLRYKL